MRDHVNDGSQPALLTLTDGLTIGVTLDAHSDPSVPAPASSR